MLGKFVGVVDALLQHGNARVFGGAHNAHDVQRFAAVHQVGHVIGVAGLVLPNAVRLVVFVVIRSADQLILRVQNGVVRDGLVIVGSGDLFLVDECFDHIGQLAGIAQAQRVQHEIVDVALARSHQHAFVVVFGPMTSHNFVRIRVKVFVLRHLIEGIGAHGHGHQAIAAARAHAQRGERFVGVHLVCAVRCIGQVDLRLHVVTVLNGIHVRLNAAGAAVEEVFERLQIVAANAAEDVRDGFCHAQLIFATRHNEVFAHGVLGVAGKAGASAGRI